MAIQHIAQITSGVVTAIDILPDGLPLHEARHPDSGWIECDNTIAAGMLYADGVFSAVPGPLLTDVQILWRLRATSQFNARIAAGFTYAGKLFQIDPASQQNIAAMASLANAVPADWPAGFYWIAADNSHAALDAPGMIAFAAAVGLYVSTCLLRLRAIKDAIATAGDVAAVEAIDVTAGYPTVSA